MARGIYKGRPDQVVTTERLILAGRYQPSARENFAVRAAALRALQASARVAVVDEGVRS